MANYMIEGSEYPEIVVRDGYEWPTTEKGAIRAALLKWRKIVRYLENDNHAVPDNGRGQTCALCHLYALDEPDWSKCRSCPVYKETGRRHCYGTPYEDYVIAHNDYSHGAEPDDWWNKKQRRLALKYARAEVRFLTSLLDGKPKKRG